MAAPPPNIMHNKDSEVSNSRTNQVIYLWTSWEISNIKNAFFSILFFLIITVFLFSRCISSTFNISSYKIDKLFKKRAINYSANLKLIDFNQHPHQNAING